MKYLILALLLPFTVSAEGLIKVPKNAEEIKSPGRLLDLDFSKAVDEPQEQSLEGYVRWVRERRDLRADFRRAFGELDGRLTGIAVAADTDNTGEEAHAGFADFRFVAAEADCPPP